MTWIPAAGTIRRIRGLHLLGHDPVAIADAALLDVALITALADMPLNPYRQVPDDVAFAVCAATAQLRSHPVADTAQSRATRVYAMDAGWMPLTVWDGDLFHIDDPHADDDLAGHTAHMPPNLRRLVLEENREAASRRAANAANRRHRRKDTAA